MNFFRPIGVAMVLSAGLFLQMGCANTPEGRQRQADYVTSQMAVAGVRAVANVATAGILNADRHGHSSRVQQCTPCPCDQLVRDWHDQNGRLVKRGCITHSHSPQVATRAPLVNVRTYQLYRSNRGEVCVATQLYTVCGEQGVRQFCSRDNVRCI
jgi:hypothetical protein